MHTTRWAAACLAGAFVLGAAAQAHASAITFTLDFTFSGTPPSGSPTITIDDGGGVGSATVTMNAGGLSGTEFIDDIYLNYTGDLASLSATFVSGELANSVSFGADAFKADGDGFYDIKFDFPPPPGGSTTLFGAGDTSVYTLTGTGLIAALFNFPSLCDQGCANGSFYAAAHVQAVGPTAGLSAWIGANDPGGPPPPPPPDDDPPQVPEPASMVLFGAGLFGLALRARKR